MPCILIDDGYNDFKGTIPAFGRWPAVTLSYRPALRADVEEYRFKVAKCNSGAETTAALVSLLAKHIKAWDVTDKADQPLPVTEANLSRVPDRILTRMFDMVTGYSESELVVDSKNA